MSKSELKSFMGQFWLQEEDGVITFGLSEEALNDFDSVESIELPAEGESFSEEEVFGQIETSDGEIELYAPKDGTVLEVNSQVLDDPNLIMEDPFGEGWLIKFEVDGDFSDDEDDDEEDEDDEDLEDDDDDDDDDDDEDFADEDEE